MTVQTNTPRMLVTTPWNHAFIHDRLPADGKLNGWSVQVDEFPAETDVWVVWGNLPRNMQVNCRKTYYVTEEVHDRRAYNQNFLAQFDEVISSRTDIVHPVITPTFELGTWHCGPSYDELGKLSSITKTEIISVVSSDLTDLPGHKKRYAFVNKLIGHFKDKLHVYGRGFNPIAEKWNALAPYKYSIAIENNAINGYFSEKLTECFLSHTMPVYAGAPDIDQYFDKDALCIINPDDFAGSVRAIEELLAEDPYDSVLPKIIRQKEQYLQRYHIFNALSLAIGKPDALPLKRKRLQPEGNFLKPSLFKRAAQRIIQKLP
ncbi:MAG: hypothetical protein INR69_18145 [Mucilaginibacter polytrichastri]|nr:hypothetical protein [Mucilaginibacter polytrichastri]